MRLNTLLKLLKDVAITTFFIGVMVYLFTAVYIGRRVYYDNKSKSDVIVVLGAKSFVDGNVNQCVLSRVRHAVDLYNDGFANKIIMSGGTDKKPVFHETNEAREMKKIALSIDPNIKESDILTEGNSTSTYENVLYSYDIMKNEGLKTAIIVTEPFHSPRANLIAQKIGLNHTVSPTQTSLCWNHGKYLTWYFLREPFVLVAYKLLRQI